MAQSLSTITRPPAYMAVLVALSVSHLLNDLMQSLIPALYPVIKETYSLDFAQIGMITLTFQFAGSLLQPIVGHVTDRYPMPYATLLGMTFTMTGLIALSLASGYATILAAAGCVGIGSSIFHPEATRMVRHAAGERQGLGQGLFQIGGQAGGSLGPLFAALIIVPRGQASLAWFAAIALLTMILLAWISGRYRIICQHLADARAASGHAGPRAPFPPATVLLGLVVLAMIMFSKNVYHESFRSFYTFYLIEQFGVSIPASQVMLFIFLLSAAAGALLGGIVGDRIGRYRIIWISVLGPLPLTLLLPHVGLVPTVILTVLINLIMASAFASILIYAMELAPDRIGLIGGLFYGLYFGMAGIAAAMIGGLADWIGLYNVYLLCAFLPLGGLFAWYLPRIEETVKG